MGKLKSEWVKTDIPKDIKIKLWRVMRDNSTYDAFQRYIANHPDLFVETEDKYVRMSRDTYRRLQQEIMLMPREDVALLPSDLQDWIAQLPERKERLESLEHGKQQIQERPTEAALSAVFTNHYGELVEVAKKLKDNLSEPILDSLKAELYPPEHVDFFEVKIPWGFERREDSDKPSIKFRIENAEPLLSSCLLCHLSHKSGPFDHLDVWRESIGKLIEKSHYLLPEIVGEIEEKMGLKTSETEVGLRLSRLAPFVLGWALLHYENRDVYPELREEAVEQQVELWCEAGSDKMRLALGSPEQMKQFQKVIRDVIDLYRSDKSPAKEIIEAAGELEKRARILADSLELVIHRGTFLGTCDICKA